MNIVIIILMGLTLLTRLVGVGREIFLAYFYGATAISDAYLMSIAIPTIIVTFIVTSLATSFIPIYQKSITNEKAQQQLTGKVMGIILMISVVIFIFSITFTRQIVILFASGFDLDAIELTVRFTRITLFAVVFMAMNQLLHAYLQVKEKVLLASLSGLPFNLVAITFIVLSFYTNHYLLPIGTVFALGLQWLYLLILAKRQHFKLRPRIRLADTQLKQLLVLALPMILASGVEQIGLVVDKNIASRFGPGAVSSLVYASRVITAFSGIIVTSVLVVTFPKIAKLQAPEARKEMKDSLAQSIIIMSLFIVPVIAAVLVFSVPVISLLFGRGAFDIEAVMVTASLLFFNIFFLFGNGLTQLVSRVFFALEDAMTPMVVAASTIGVNIVLNIMLTMVMGLAGLALATSISALLGLFVLFYLLRRKIGSLRLRSTLISLGKIVGAAVPMAVGAYFAYRAMVMFHDVLALLVAALVGMVIYGIVLLVLRIREVEDIVVFLINYLRKIISKQTGGKSDGL